MSECGLNDYMMALGVMMLSVVLVKGFWEDYRHGRTRHDLQELARLRALYTPAKEQEIRERKRLAELETQYQVQEGRP